MIQEMKEEISSLMNEMRDMIYKLLEDNEKKSSYREEKEICVTESKISS